MKLLNLLIFFTFTACTSSSGGNETATVITAEEQAETGWNSFESGNYDDALNTFNEALAKDSTLVEAISGKGWTYIFLDNLNEAESTLNISVSNRTDDINAGLAFIYNATNDYQSSIDAALLLLNNGTWVFSYNSQIDHMDVRLVLAQSYLSRGDFTNAKATFLVIEPTFNADVNTQAGQLELLQAIEAKNPGLNPN